MSAPTHLMRRLASFLTLGLLAVLGAFLILAATPEGLGLSDDSIAYIAGARSLLAGDGYREAWLESNQPVTHFPPVFSGTLALIGLTGIDPINGARLVNALLFGINAALLGLLGWRATKSSMPSRRSSSWPFSTLHTTIRVLPAEAIRVPSGLQATHFVPPPCPLRLAMTWPSRFQIFTVVS